MDTINQLKPNGPANADPELTEIDKARLQQQMMDCAFVKAFEESMIKELELGHIDQVLEWLHISVSRYTESIRELAQKLEFSNEVAQQLGYCLCRSKEEELNIRKSGESAC